MIDNSLIHSPKTTGISKSLLKMNQVRKIALGLTVYRVQFRFYLGFGENLLIPTFVLLYFYRNIPSPALFMDVL